MSPPVKTGTTVPLGRPLVVLGEGRGSYLYDQHPDSLPYDQHPDSLPFHMTPVSQGTTK